MQILLADLLARLGKVPVQETQIRWRFLDFVQQAPVVAVVVEPLTQQEAMVATEVFLLLVAVVAAHAAFLRASLAQVGLVELEWQSLPPTSKCPFFPNSFPRLAVSSVARLAALPWRLLAKLSA